MKHCNEVKIKTLHVGIDLIITRMLWTICTNLIASWRNAIVFWNFKLYFHSNFLYLPRNVIQHLYIFLKSITVWIMNLTWAPSICSKAALDKEKVNMCVNTSHAILFSIYTDFKQKQFKNVLIFSLN